MRHYGLPHGWPYQPSTIWGPETPSPAMTRWPPASASSLPVAIAAKTEVPCLGGVSERSAAAEVDRPILRADGKPTLAFEVQPQFLPYVLSDAAAWVRDPHPWQESSGESWIPVLPIGNRRDEACAHGKQERQSEECHDTAMGQRHR